MQFRQRLADMIEGSAVPRIVVSCGSVLVLLFMSSPAIELHAQTIGARIGVTKPQSATGMAIGGYVAVPFTGNFNLRPELLYSVSKSSPFFASYFGQYDGQPTLFEDKTEQRVGYLEVPLLGTLDVPVTDKLAFSVAAGPSASMRMHCTWRTNTNVIAWNGELVDEIQGEQEDCVGESTPDVGIVLGGGVGFGAGHLKAILDLRYRFGITEISSDQRNNLFAASIGVGYRL